MALAVALAAGPEALAQSRMTVVGRAGADPPVSPLEAAAAVADAAVGAGRVAVAAPRRLANRRLSAGAVAAERLDDFARARSLLVEGWNAYLRVQVEFAEARLVLARRTAIEVLDLDGGPALLADASLRLGAVRLQQGRSAEAAEDFRLAHAVDETREVGLAEFAPGIVAAYEAAVSSDPGRAPIRIDSSAIATRIEINGRSVESATLSVPVGLVAVVARAPGRRAIKRLLSVPKDGVTLELRFERDALASSLDGGTDFSVGAAEVTAAIEAAALIAFAEIDDLVFVAPVWNRGRPALLGQRCSGVPVRCTPVVERGFAGPASLRAAANALWRELAGQRLSRSARGRALGPTLLSDRRLRRGERRPGGGAGEERRWYRSPWVWAGAAAAVAVGVAVGFALDGGDSVQTSVVVPPCDFAACE